MIVGGVLTPLYAEVRQTQDVDIVVATDFSPENCADFLSVLKAHKFQPFTSWKDAFATIPATTFATILSPNVNYKIDLNFIREPSANN